MQLINNLNWRYAAKRYSNKKLSKDKLNMILDAMRLSASSGGLQPYRLFVIDNPETRKKLGENSFNLQITEASHLIAIASFSRLRQKDIDTYINQMAQVRNSDLQAFQALKTSMENYYLNLSDEEVEHWAAKQAYIALGTGLIAAADLKVDSSPMEGFDSEKLDHLLGLEEKGLKSVVLLALGYRDQEKDRFSSSKKVRLPKEELIKIV